MLAAFVRLVFLLTFSLGKNRSSLIDVQDPRGMLPSSSPTSFRVETSVGVNIGGSRPATNPMAVKLGFVRVVLLSIGGKISEKN